MPVNTRQIDDDESVQFRDGEETDLLTNHKWKYTSEMESFLRSIPKIELHVHLDGSFETSLLLEHLKSLEDFNHLPSEITLPWDTSSTMPIRSALVQCETVQDLHALCTCRGKRSLYEMIKCFEIFLPIVRGNLELLETLSYNFCRRQSKCNVIYSEVRYSPHLLAEGGDYNGTDSVDARPVIDAVTRGLRRGEKDFNVKINQILCCIQYRPDWATEVIELACERRNDAPCAVVGVDIAAGEDHFDHLNYAELHHPHFEAFQLAKSHNLNITIHAGEVGDSTFVKKAVYEYGAKRIGHGYRICHEPDVMEDMKVRNIHFEICPTSSYETGGWQYEHNKNWAEHPAVKMFRYGLNIGLNSDDPSVFDTSCTWQYRIATGKMGFTKECILKTIHNSINAAFLNDQEKEALRSELDKWYKFYTC